MTTFTKEQLISHARESVSYLEDLKGRVSKEGEDCKVVLEMVERELELARIALASLEADPIAWRYRYVKKGVTDSQGEPWVGDWKYVPTKEDCNDRPSYEIQALFTAPPVPVKSEGLGKADNPLASSNQVGELTMWIKRLVSQLKKANPDCKLPEKAMDYLKRNELISAEDVLR